MNNPNFQKTASFIESRFVDLMLSDDFAMQRLGISNDSVEDERASTMLDIEAQAAEQKQKQKKAEQEFKVYVSEYFHDHLFNYLDEKLNDSDYIFHELLPFEPEIAKLFDVCAAKASGVNQFAQLISAVPWLKQRFLHMVNNPPFREANSSKPTVEKVDLAVRYIGIDNAKTALLAQVARYWLPHSTEPYAEFKNKHWKYSVATANCMAELAKVYKLNETTAFFFGLFHNIGMALTLRLYLRAFDAVRIEQMKESLKTDRKDIEQVLNTLEIDPHFIHDALRKYSFAMTQKVFEKFELKFAVVAPFAEELANQTAFTDAAPMTQALMQAKTFAQYKILQKARIIELDEAKVFLTNYRVNNTIISALNKVNLTNFKFSL